MNLPQVLKKISEMLTTPEGEVVLAEAGLVAGAVSPPIGVVAESLSVFLQQFDKFKLRMLLRGLSKDLNVEKHLNELYSYVSSSSSRAFTVGNVFRETVAAKSPKICMLYGLILAKHIGEQNSDFTIEDIIVCNALENASDYDLDNFKELMELWINQEGIIEYPKEEKDKFEKTCLWCVYSRLFSIHGYTWAILAGEDDPESKTVKTNYIVDNSAKTLLNLISELGQIWNY